MPVFNLRFYETKVQLKMRNAVVDSYRLLEHPGVFDVRSNTVYAVSSSPSEKKTAIANKEQTRDLEIRYSKRSENTIVLLKQFVFVGSSTTLKQECIKSGHLLCPESCFSRIPFAYNNV